MLKTPALLIKLLAREIVRVLNKADVEDRFIKAGSEVVASSPEQFAAAMKSDMATMGKVMQPR